jgi:LPS export ABC transporter protein LptC
MTFWKANCSDDGAKRTNQIKAGVVKQIVKKITLIFVLLAMLLGLQACEERPPEESSETVGPGIPDQIITDSETYLTRGNRRTGVIRAEILMVYSSKDTTLLYDVEVEFYDTTGMLSSTLVADSGRVTRNSTRFAVFGDVRGHAVSGKKLLTDSLRWNAESDMVETEGFVKFIRAEVDTLSGWGLEADARLEDVRIKRNIRGSFREPDNRDE